MFKCLPFIKGCGSQLECVDKRHSNLSHVPDEVMRNSRTLEECRLDANQIKDLPNNFFRLEKVRQLTISDNLLTKLPPLIGNFSFLAELDISRNDIEELPPSLRFCDSLQTLDVSNNPLKSLPEGFCQLKNLRVLSLNDVSLVELPPDFGYLKKLQKLELRENCLSTLPASFGHLINLEFLDMGGNDFSELPPFLGALQKLLEFWLDDNQIVSIPMELGGLRSLQQWDLSDNNLTSLPPSISGLISLSDLNLTQNNLASLPDEIGDLRKLTVLKVIRNQLADLTPSIGSCDNLLELYLTENYLQTLPSTIGKLTKMFHFNVDKNHLNDIPVEIGLCVSLNILSLRDNHLRRLPWDLGKCNCLRVIDVSGNRLERLPVSLVYCPLTALWLSPSQAQPIVALQRAVDEPSNEEYLTCYLLPQETTDDINDETVAANSSLSNSKEASIAVNQHSENGLVSLTRSISNNASLTKCNTSILDHYSENFSKLSNEEQHPVAGKSSSATYPTPPEELQRDVLSNHFLPSPLNADRSDSICSENKDISASSRVRFTQNEPKSSQDASGKHFGSKEYPKTRHPMLIKKIPGVITNDLYSDFNTVSPQKCISNSMQPSIANSSAVSDLREKIIANGGSDSKLTAESPSNQLVGRLPSKADGDMSHPKNLEHISRNDSNLPNSDISINPLRRPEPLSLLVNDTNGHANLSEIVDDRLDTNSPKPHSSSSDVDAILEANIPPPSNLHSEISESRQETLMFANPFRKDNGEPVSTSPLPKMSNHLNVDDLVYSSGGEEIDTFSKSVAFGDDVEDNEVSSQKLIRRDTPHYTKRARIHKKNSDGANNEEVVLELLKKYHDPFVEDPSSDNSKTANALLAVAAAAAAAEAHPASSECVPGVGEVTMNIFLQRATGGGLGLSIAGGVGSVPFRGLDQGIFVSRLASNGLAESAGLRVGDKIKKINGVSMLNVEHNVAVSALRTDDLRFELSISREESRPISSTEYLGGALNSKQDTSKMLLRSDLPDPNSNLPLSLLNTTAVGRSMLFGSRLLSAAGQSNAEHIKCTLNRDWSGLGFSVAGGCGLSLPRNSTATIYISRIVEGGAADKSGRLRVGDQLVKINGIDVRSARHDQVITLLSGSGNLVALEVLRNHYGSPHLSRSASPTSPFISGYSQHDDSLENTKNLPNGICSETVHLRYEDGFPVEIIEIERRKNMPLGFSICGGSDVSCLPFDAKSCGIFVSRISQDGLAKELGMHVGDRILSVNSIDIRNSTHDEAVQIMIDSGELLRLEVRRDPPPPGFKEVSIKCQPLRKIGLNLVSFRSPPPTSSPLLSSEDLTDGIFVSHIAPGGAVDIDGRLKIGDRLLEANSVWLMGLDLHEVAELLKTPGDVLHLTVCDGADPSGLLEQAKDCLQSDMFPPSLNECNLIDCDLPVEERVKPLNHQRISLIGAIQ